MSERYRKVFSLTPDLYASGSPVVIEAGALLQDNQTGKMLAQLKLKSVSPQILKVIKVKLIPLDSVGRELGESVAYEYLDLRVRRDEEFGQKNAISLPDPSTRSFRAEVVEAGFADNSVWSASGAEWKALPKPESLEKVLGSAELKKQYQIRYGNRAEFMPVQSENVWICACGEINMSGEESCHHCGAKLTDMLACDLDELKVEKNQRVAREEAERIAREAAEKEAEEARLAAEKEEAARKKKKTVKTLAIVLPILAVCVAALAIVTQVLIPNGKYNAAVSLMEAGQYEEAAEAFDALKGYKDSEAQSESCRDIITEQLNAESYSEAEALLEEEKYEEALEIFEALGDYQDSSERAEEVRQIIGDLANQPAKEFLRYMIASGGGEYISSSFDAEHDPDLLDETDDDEFLVGIAAGLFDPIYTGTVWYIYEGEKYEAPFVLATEAAGETKGMFRGYILAPKSDSSETGSSDSDTASQPMNLDDMVKAFSAYNDGIPIYQYFIDHREDFPRLSGSEISDMIVGEWNIRYSHVVYDYAGDHSEIQYFSDGTKASGQTTYTWRVEEEMLHEWPNSRYEGKGSLYSIRDLGNGYYGRYEVSSDGSEGDPDAVMWR